MRTKNTVNTPAPATDQLTQQRVSEKGKRTMLFRTFMRIKIQVPILFIFLVLLLSVGFYISQLLYTNSDNARSSRIYEQSLVGAINQYEYLPALVGRDELMRETVRIGLIDHLPASERLKFIANRSGADAVYIMNREGKVTASSNYDDPKGGFLHQNYSFRPYFSRAMAEGKRQFYYAQGATTGIPGFFIASPIINGSSKQPMGVAVVKLDLSHWEQKWRDSGEGIIVADQNKVIILSSEAGWRYRSIGLLPEEVRNRISSQQQFAGKIHTNLFSKSVKLGFADNLEKAFWLVDNTLYLVNSFTIDQTGWTLYYLVKHDSILASSLIFFIVLSIVAIMAYLIFVSRMHIIESKHQHRNLEIKRREELQTVMDNIHIGVILFSKEGNLLSANKHARQMLIEERDFAEDEVIPIDQIVDIDFHNFNQLLLQDISAPAYHETKTISRDKDPIPVMFAISEVSTIDQDVYLMTLMNIKRRKDAENKLVKINERLEDMVNDRTHKLQEAQGKLMQKNKAAALGNMAATIVHELSQPLAAMNSSIAAVNAKVNNNDWQGASDSASRLGPLSKKMHNVIKLLKFFSYQDSTEHSTTDINQNIGQVLENLKDTLKERQVNVITRLAEQELLVSANTLKLDLVLSNIIQNAIDALESVETPNIIVQSREVSGLCQITIQDNAGGVNEDIKEKMFTPYFTTKQVGKGLGLGLAITYEIIQEYGGTIEVANLNEGACFTISLPLLETGNTVQKTALK